MAMARHLAHEAYLLQSAVRFDDGDRARKERNRDGPSLHVAVARG